VVLDLVSGQKSKYLELHDRDVDGDRTAEIGLGEMEGGDLQRDGGRDRRWRAAREEGEKEVVMVEAAEERRMLSMGDDADDCDVTNNGKEGRRNNGEY
jgi:hypothetical protein